LTRLLAEELAVLILDVHMPEMDGIEPAALIREHSRASMDKDADSRKSQIEVR
jgi:CheY-like chemotaxis protein